MCVLLLVSVSILLPLLTVYPSQVFADDPNDEYFRIHTITVDGTSIDKITINGPPDPPPSSVRVTVELPEPNQAADLNTLANVPAFNWCFGCSATAGAMIAGYYDRTGYGNMYTGPTNGGVMPLDNSSWSDWYDGYAWRHRCPLSATHNSLDGRDIFGHVDDYWVVYGDPGPDPFIDNWTEHTYGDCTGDYMKTNQSLYGNVDGETSFWNYTNGAPLHDYELEALGAGYYDLDGGYGLRLFYESRGYIVTTMYNQYIYGYEGNTLGFTFDQYKEEIDAGRPVMIHLEGHTVVGLGYDDATNLVYIHDTWDYSTHTMTWGSSYGGMLHMGVTIVQLGSPASQRWYLTDIVSGTNYVMNKGSSGGTQNLVILGGGENAIWHANEAAGVTVGFQASDWTGDIHQAGRDSVDPIRVDIGLWDGSSFTSYGYDTGSVSSGASTWSFVISASAFDVTGGQYLGFKVTNNTILPNRDLELATDGTSFITSPTTDPGYPVPELSTIILLGVGLASLVGYIVLSRYKKKKEFIVGC